MAKQASGTQQCRINVGGGTVDRADDLQTKKVGEHSVREVQDGAHLIAVVGASSHKRGIRILQDYDKPTVGMNPALVGPKSDEFRFGEDSHRRRRDKVETM